MRGLGQSITDLLSLTPNEMAQLFYSFVGNTSDQVGTSVANTLAPNMPNVAPPAALQPYITSAGPSVSSNADTLVGYTPTPLPGLQNPPSTNDVIWLGLAGVVVFTVVLAAKRR